MKLVKRYDYSPGGNSKVEMTPEGFMRVHARAAKVGVMKYRQADGSIIRELVPPETLFDEGSMATLAMKPVTNNHPSALLDSETAPNYTVGFTGETVKKDEDKYLAVSTVITDKRTIQDAESGKVEVSPGYTCELDFTPGKFDGEEYDAVQKNRRYNHLAVVGKGRGGPEVRLKLDADDAVQVELNKPEEKRMKIKLDGKEFEVADEVGAAMNAEMKKKEEEANAAKVEAKDAKAACQDAEKAKDQAEAKADGLDAEIKKLKAQRTDSADVQKLVKARIALEKTAERAGVEKFDALSDLDLKKAVIKVDSPDVSLDGKSEEYINARFDMASEAIDASDEAAKKLGGKINEGKRQAEVMDSDAARQRMIERQQKAWKGEEK